MPLEILTNKELEGIKVGDWVTRPGWELFYEVTKVDRWTDSLWLFAKSTGRAYAYKLTDPIWKIK